MIDSRETLREYLRVEKELCIANGYRGKIHAILSQCEIGKITGFLEILRKDEYYSNTRKNSYIKKIIAGYYRRKHNMIGLKLGISIPINTFGKGLMIYHYQGIIVHRDVRCGEFCKLHGLTCIGNNGSENAGQNTPVLGNHIDIGVGAKIIGSVTLADHIRIAAGAVVCKSFLEQGITISGIPASEKI